jgi:hypothetical protein
MFTNLFDAANGSQIDPTTLKTGGPSGSIGERSSGWVAAQAAASVSAI